MEFDGILAWGENHAATLGCDGGGVVGSDRTSRGIGSSDLRSYISVDHCNWTFDIDNYQINFCGSQNFYFVQIKHDTKAMSFVSFHTRTLVKNLNNYHVRTGGNFHSCLTRKQNCTKWLHLQIDHFDPRFGMQRLHPQRISHVRPAMGTRGSKELICQGLYIWSDFIGYEFHTPPSHTIFRMPISNSARHVPCLGSSATGNSANMKRGRGWKAATPV